MPRRFLLSLLLLTCSFSGQAGELVFAGVYQGKNVYVQNPAVGTENGIRVFCTQEVFVNSRRMMWNIGSSAYEINLSSLRLHDSVTVRILHRDGCTPKIINPQVLRPNQSFQFVSIDLSRESVKWTVSGDPKGSSYAVQQLVNSNWLTVKTINSNGSGIYAARVVHHTGLNKYRIKHSTVKGNISYSREAQYEFRPTDTQGPVTFYPKSVTDKIFLSRPARYEVRDPQGHVLKKGQGKEIQVSGLKTGLYVLALGDRNERFFKK